MKKKYIGIDIGGTSVKVAFLDESGVVIDKWEVLTNTDENGKNIVTDITNSIFINLKKHFFHISDFMGVGIGVPGFINMETGFVYKAVNLGWENYNLKEIVENTLHLPVVIENDANLAAIGEMWKGAGNNSKNVLCVTLGTGVGGGVVVNGDIVHGTNGMAGEIGHYQSILEGGHLCNCGKFGCLETICSATGLSRLANKSIFEHKNSHLFVVYSNNGTISSRDIFDGAKMLDDYAIDIVNLFSAYLAIALANISIVVNPEVIVIGGGVSNAGGILIKYLDIKFKKYALPRIYDGTKLELARLGNDAGIIGAAWLVQNKFENKK